jgi:putative two-component system response regulator
MVPHFDQGAALSISEQVKRSINRFLPGASPRPAAAARDDPSLVASVTAENEQLRETNIELLEILGAVVDALSPYTIYHSAQVAIYALEIARVMRLGESDQERIFRAGLVHDVGMISMSSTAITKDEKLTDEDYQDLRLHPTIGGEIVGRIQNLRELAPLVHHHHERYDGAGYPDRLAGEEIPLGARILALADTVDAMLTDRPNRPANPLALVLHEVKCCSGTQFDPRVVRAFLQVAAEKPPAFFDSTNTGTSNEMMLSTAGISTGRARDMLRKGKPNSAPPAGSRGAY